MHAVSGEATYLLWIDATNVSLPAEVKKTGDLSEYIRQRSGLYLSDGREYRNGDGFLRMNLACPRSRVIDGLQRLKECFA